jgi:hypothetical protein
MPETNHIEFPEPAAKRLKRAEKSEPKDVPEIPANSDDIGSEPVRVQVELLSANGQQLSANDYVIVINKVPGCH